MGRTAALRNGSQSELLRRPIPRSWLIGELEEPVETHSFPGIIRAHGQGAP